MNTARFIVVMQLRLHVLGCFRLYYKKKHNVLQVLRLAPWQLQISVGGWSFCSRTLFSNNKFLLQRLLVFKDDNSKIYVRYAKYFMRTILYGTIFFGTSLYGTNFFFRYGYGILVRSSRFTY